MAIFEKELSEEDITERNAYVLDKLIKKYGKEKLCNYNKLPRREKNEILDFWGIAKCSWALSKILPPAI